MEALSAAATYKNQDPSGNDAYYGPYQGADVY